MVIKTIGSITAKCLFLRSFMVWKPRTIHKDGATRRGGCLYIDVLKVFAALGVVLLHANHVFWEGPSSPAWVSANLIETLFYWSAPMFFMITGATLLNYQQRMSTRQYCARRIRSTVIPYCAWTVIAIVFFAFGPFRAESTELSARQILKAFLRPESSPFTLSIYWFFPALFGVYVAIPFLASMQRRYLKALTLVLVIFESAIPTLSTLLGTKLLNADFLNALSVGYVMFAVLGYILSVEEMPLGWRCILYLCGALAWGAEFFGTLEVSNITSGVVKTYKGYLSFFCVLQTSAVFVLTRSICARLEKFSHCKAYYAFQQLISKLAPLTFGVYLIHKYLVTYLPEILPVDQYSLGWRLGGGLAIFAVCSLLTAVIAKIPYANKVLLGRR